MIMDNCFLLPIAELQDDRLIKQRMSINPNNTHFLADIFDLDQKTKNFLKYVVCQDQK